MEEIKKILYFPLASYFKFFAQIRLRRWDPKIVVVTGSSGKTTLLHLLETQIGANAKYSHHANSSYGIPFDILGLNRDSLLPTEWISLILKTPAAVFKKIPKEKIYVVEADCDRPDEGKFLASLLRPDIVLWLNVSRTHSMNFDSLVSQKKFASVDEAIAFEYGYFLEYCSEYVIINGDSVLQTKQEKRTKAKVIEILKKKYLDDYSIDQRKTMFTVQQQRYAFNALLPEEIFYSLAMCKVAVEHLNLPFDDKFADFILPPGRSSVFLGIKDTTLIDSSYNANLSSTKALLSMFDSFQNQKKWVVVGDMLELGKSEKEEHEELAEILFKMDLEKIILLGPRTAKYTVGKLEELGINPQKIASFQSLKEVDEFIHHNLNEGEAILFKGSQSMFLEGVIEKLLKNKSDADRLPRREQFWRERRKQKGL
jgi:UDP-N-acetylmuramoyl-tripeptide--D-alanyl-D-alanine ligase